MHPIKVKFFPPESGWIRIILTYKGKDIPIYSSSIFDPYPALLNWLEKVFENALPARWHIDEEDTFIDFVADVDDAGKSRLQLIGQQRDEEYEDQRVYTFIEDPNLTEIAKEIYRSFRDMLANEFDPKEWGADIRMLDWERLDKYLSG